ncbi:hypothetical protein [Kistimonas asteriae]|uniref:hypothetical protein n=1 Tax=Kistimonas asteriae TaxID=517724 RepID=UPI001BACFAAF|nr:hypothetical protein [Kistimonas asteriae]
MESRSDIESGSSYRSSKPLLKTDVLPGKKTTSAPIAFASTYELRMQGGKADIPAIAVLKRTVTEVDSTTGRKSYPHNRNIASQEVTTLTITRRHGHQWPVYQESGLLTIAGRTLFDTELPREDYLTKYSTPNICQLLAFLYTLPPIEDVAQAQNTDNIAEISFTVREKTREFGGRFISLRFSDSYMSGYLESDDKELQLQHESFLRLHPRAFRKVMMFGAMHESLLNDAYQKVKESGLCFFIDPLSIHKTKDPLSSEKTSSFPWTYYSELLAEIEVDASITDAVVAPGRHGVAALSTDVTHAPFWSNTPAAVVQRLTPILESGQLTAVTLQEPLDTKKIPRDQSDPRDRGDLDYYPSGYHIEFTPKSDGSCWQTITFHGSELFPVIVADAVEL